MKLNPRSLPALASIAVLIAPACESPTTESRDDPSVCPEASYFPSFLPPGTLEDGSGAGVSTRTPPIVSVLACTPFVLRLEIPEFDPEAGIVFLSAGAVVDGD